MGTESTAHLLDGWQRSAVARRADHVADLAAQPVVVLAERDQLVDVIQRGLSVLASLEPGPLQLPLIDVRRVDAGWRTDNPCVSW
jgi:hypothetical protein